MYLIKKKKNIIADNIYNILSQVRNILIYGFIMTCAFFFFCIIISFGIKINK